ncbi:WYL domain-containing protein [Nonomuraea sp. NPDC023979]|uniref:helix-turn-helix transcriptional regulator n=1 Tax=Nonomuraea sp. NPDC023979 TaxID=3154796 RepID=UPI0033F54572
MLETSARLLKLLSLLQTHREWSGTELAGRLGVTARTVRRDVERLRELGYQVHATAGAPGYRLGAGGNLPPLLLDDEEAVAVAVGLRTAAQGSVAGIEETSLRALAKLERVLPSRLRRRVNAVQSMTVPMTGRAPAVDPDALAAIAAACRDHESLRFDYCGAGGAVTTRVVEPHRLVATGRRWYLVAFDPGRDDWRLFRVDRVRLRTPNGPRFTPRRPPDTDLAGYASRRIAEAPYRFRGRFTVHAPAAAVAERLSPSAAAVEPLSPASCLLTAGGDSLDEMASWLVSLGVPFEVHEPPELADHLRVLAARLAGAAGGQ